METTRMLAEFLVNTNYEDIPQRVKDIAKRTALDLLGVALAGVPEPASKVISSFVRKSGGLPEAGVIGKGFRTSAPYAGLANGTMADALDYNDCGIIIGHPSVLVLPTVISLGDKLHASGKEILTAYILAVEIEGKVSLGCDLGAGRESITHFAFLGGLGAAAAAAKLLKLDIHSTRIAFGIVTNLASGLPSAAHGTWLGPTKAGNVSYNGMLAAFLAREGSGLPANPSIIECSGGLCDTFVGQGNYNLDIMTRDLGNPFYFESPGITIKKYPSCFITHRALDGVLQLLQTHHISYEDIAEVEVGITQRALRVLSFPEPSSGYEGKFSMPYCVASALIDKKVNLGTFTDAKIHNPRVKEAMSKVRLSYPDLPIFSGLSQVDVAHPTTVGNPITIRLKDGRSYSARVDIPRGSPEAPLTEKELLSKYSECAQSILSLQEVKESVELVLNLEETKNFRQVMDIVCRMRPHTK